MTATCPDDHDLINDNRPPGCATTPVRKSAPAVRACSDRLPSSYRSTRAYWQEPRLGLVGHGHGYVLVEAEGSVDIACRDELTDVLTRAVGVHTPAVIVDLSGVTLLAAAGYGCLREAAVLLASTGGCLHIVCPPGSAAARLVTLLGTGGWHLHDDLPAAVAAAGGQ